MVRNKAFLITAELIIITILLTAAANSSDSPRFKICACPNTSRFLDVKGNIMVLPFNFQQVQDTTVAVTDTLVFAIDLIQWADRYDPGTGRVVDSLRVDPVHLIYARIALVGGSPGDSLLIGTLEPSETELVVPDLPSFARYAIGYKGEVQGLPSARIWWSTDQEPQWTIQEETLVVVRRGTRIYFYLRRSQ